MNTILVPLDGSRCAVEALLFAEVLAAPLQARIVLLEVVWKAGEWSQHYAAPPGGPVARDPEEWGAQIARAHLTRVAAGANGHRMDVDVRLGPPVEGILRAAADTACELVCIAGHSQTLVARMGGRLSHFGLPLPPARHVEPQAPWVLHHVLEDLLRRSPVPVLVVPVASGNRPVAAPVVTGTGP